MNDQMIMLISILACAAGGIAYMRRDGLNWVDSAIAGSLFGALCGMFVAAIVLLAKEAFA